MTICERIFDLIASTKGKNAAGLCKALDLNTSVTTNWKQRNTDPPAKYIIPICEYLGVSVMFLLTGEDSIPRDQYSAEEQELVGLFRELDASGKRIIIGRLEEERRRAISEKGTGNAKIG